MPPDPFSAALTAIRADSEAVDRIAMNMANVLTPGYRRMRAGAAGFGEALRQQGATDAGLAGPRVDSRNGALKMTGRNLDVALMGPGYFELRTPAGPAWTRQGAFGLSDAGVLVGPGGHPVVGRHGEEVHVAASASLRISADGGVYAVDGDRGDVLATHLKVVQPEPGIGMLHRGGGLYAAPEHAMRAVPEASVRVRQGALETSNVQSAEEMTDLMRTARHLESVIRGVQTYDNLIGMAIRTLGEVR